MSIGRPALEVMATGPLALIQDLGRPGLAAMGVGRSGAADRRSFRLGARLLAQDNTAAAIEVTFGGLAFPPATDAFAAAVALRDSSRAFVLAHCGEPDVGSG